MTCQDYRDLMMGYLDNELDAEQRQAFEAHLASCPDCKKEIEEFTKLKQITDDVKLVEPEDRLWQQYWGGLYNRLERGIGWVMFSVAGILLLDLWRIHGHREHHQGPDHQRPVQSRPRRPARGAGHPVRLHRPGANLFLEQRPLQRCKEIERCFWRRRIRSVERR